MRRLPAPPPRALRRRPWRESELVALDFETTGLDLRTDTVVSFGLVPVVRGRIDLAWSRYQEVRPRTPMSHRSITVHHLRPADLADAPPLHDVLPSLRDGLERRLILVWHGEIEAAFLARILGGSARRWRGRMVDVLRLAVAVDRVDGVAAASYALADVVARRGLPVEEAHHALNDALMTAELFLALAPRLPALGLEDVRSVLRRSRP
jgi:DNA polymerase III subunit epsilon